MRSRPLAWIALVLTSLPLLRAAEPSLAGLDRHALVTRHNLTWNVPTGQIPLGNGEFCFNADASGLQTFGGNSMAHWAWHSFPLPEGWTTKRVPTTGTFQQGRNRGPDVFAKEHEALRTWMFDNPHAMNLGQLQLCRATGVELTVPELSGLTRTLDLWSGTQTSRYQIDGQPVQVTTCVHPSLDAVTVRIESPLVARGELQVALDFPYPSLQNDPTVGDFASIDRHKTEMALRGERRADFRRVVDDTIYYAGLAWSPGGTLHATADTPRKKLTIQAAHFGAEDRWQDVTEKVAARVANDTLGITPDGSWLGDPLPGKVKRLKMTYTLDGQEKHVEIAEHAHFAIRGGPSPHRFLLSASGVDRLELVCLFSHTEPAETLPAVEESLQAAAQHWQDFWSTGGAIDLSESKDSRWFELERRIVLSQYLLAAQSAGSFPSAETGLMGLDPWRSQFHLEMVWWHVAHYALWDRWSLAERSVDCYRRFAPAARALAEQLGYRGLKWPKSVGPEGRSAPWIGNQVLLWKQPHPIFLAELEYRLRPSDATLKKWAAIVHGTAEHMADYATRDEATGVYSLVPAMPPSEQGITRDTVFDLAYWRWGLDQAQEWRQRQGLPREPHWDEVRQHLAPLPVHEGVFVHSAEWLDTYSKRAWEHPDPVGVFGMLPPTEGVDPQTAHRTVCKVWDTWDWNRCWGWDCPWMAMAAARTGEPTIALEALLKDSQRNQFDERGVNTGGPCPYLPGNGGLLYAVALMAAGWDGAPDRPTPGFPADGSWTVRWEGLKKAP